MPTTLGPVLLLLTLPLAVGHESKPLSDASVVTCEYPSSGENIAKWVSSVAGFSAAVEVSASVTGSGDHRSCVTSWKLHVRRKRNNERVHTVAERQDNPGDEEWIQENSFEINGWSKDGHLLLATQIEVQGDWDETTPVVFDFATGQLWRVALYPLFQRMIPAHCSVVYRAVGFSSDNSVLIDSLSTDDDRVPGTEPCFPVSRWKLNFRKGTITRLETER